MSHETFEMLVSEILDDNSIQENINKIINSDSSNIVTLMNLVGLDYKKDLVKADLSGADLSGANLSEADLRRADLSEADLRRADLSGADLSGANLSEANLYRANLYRANLYRANLSGVLLYRANLSGSLLIGTGLLKLEATPLSAIFDDKTIWDTTDEGDDDFGTINKIA